MSFKKGMKYLKCIDILEADIKLNEINIVSVPHMKVGDRKKLIKKYGNIIESNMEHDALSENKTMTTTQFANYLKGRMNADKSI